MSNKELKQQIALHLEHEKLWGLEEIPTPTSFKKPSSSPYLWVVDDKNGLSDHKNLELLKKMLAAIQIPLEKCEIVLWPQSPSDWDKIMSKRPRALLAFGETAQSFFSPTTSSLAQKFTQIPVVITHSPAHLRENPQDKRDAWNALKHLAKQLSLSKDFR